MGRSSDIHVKDSVLLSTKHLHLKDKPGKLHPFFLGLFQVIQKIRRNAMELGLLDSISVHLVFNVFLLKKCKGERLIHKVV